MFSPLPFFHNIGYIIQSLIGRDNDHLIPAAHHVLTVRHDQHTVTVNRCDQQIFFQRQFLKLNVKDRRRLPDHKFQCFHTVVYQAVKCLYITADGIFHGTYITHDVFCRHILRINDTVKIQFVDDFIERGIVYFCDTLDLRCMLFCKE